MNHLKSIVYAARLRTLPLAFSCIITGQAMAYYLGAFHWGIFILSIITTLLLQILSNFSNDVGDSEKGTDNEDRIGPKRAIQSGLMTVEDLKRLSKITKTLALTSGLILLYFSFLLWWEKLILFLVGLAALWAADNYTNGKIAYGYRAFGDFFVFIFFGIVGVMGSFFLNIHQFNNAAILPAVGLGFLTTSVLHLNNMRDMVNDAQSGKITMAIRCGYENSKIYYTLLILLGISSWGSYVWTQNIVNLYSYIYWLGFVPLLITLFKFWRIKEYKDYDHLLKPTALSCFLLSILFFLSQLF